MTTRTRIFVFPTVSRAETRDGKERFIRNSWETRGPSAHSACIFSFLPRLLQMTSLAVSTPVILKINTMEFSNIWQIGASPPKYMLLPQISKTYALTISKSRCLMLPAFSQIQCFTDRDGSSSRSSITMMMTDTIRDFMANWTFLIHTHDVQHLPTSKELRRRQGQVLSQIHMPTNCDN